MGFVLAAFSRAAAETAEPLEDGTEYRLRPWRTPRARAALCDRRRRRRAPRSRFETKLLRMKVGSRVFTGHLDRVETRSLVSVFPDLELILKLSAWPAYTEREDRERLSFPPSQPLSSLVGAPSPPGTSRPRPYLHPTHFIGPSQ